MRYLLIILLFSLVSCSKSDDVSAQLPPLNEGGTFDEGKNILEREYQEIIKRTEAVYCSNASEWEYTAIGHKPCGGPANYIAFSKKIDKQDFLNRVKRYTEAHRAFNQKWGLVSDCAMVMPPNRIVCKDGKAKLIY